MSLKKIYTALNSTEAHLIQGLLEQNSIVVHIQGEEISNTWGSLNTEFSKIILLVAKKDYEKALTYISNYRTIINKKNNNDKNWECIECSNINPDSFELCWSCQKNRT